MLAAKIPVRSTYVAHGILALFAVVFSALNLFLEYGENVASQAGLGIFLGLIAVIPVGLSLLVAAYSVVAVFRVRGRGENVPRDMILLPIGLILGTCTGYLIGGLPATLGAVLMLAYALFTFVLLARGPLRSLGSVAALTLAGLVVWGSVSFGESNALRASLNASGPNADLINAIQAGDTASVRLMLQGGRNPNAPGYQGQLPLVAAAQYRCESCLRLLVDHGATPDAADYFDRTPLMLAARSGDSAAVSILLGLGANPNRAVHSEAPVRASEIGCTPLLFACKYGSPAVIRLLVGKGANVNAKLVDREDKSRNGMTAMSTAAERGHAEIVAFLAASGAQCDPQQVNEALLRGASLHGDTAQVRALLNLGTAVNGATQYEKWTPLMKAMRSTREWDRDMEPPGSWAREHPPLPSPAVVRLLISAGGDVNARDENRTSVLGMAIEEDGGLEIVRSLLAAGARVRIDEDLFGSTPLSVAKDKAKYARPDSQEILAMLKHAK